MALQLKKEAGSLKLLTHTKQLIPLMLKFIVASSVAPGSYNATGTGSFLDSCASSTASAPSGEIGFTITVVAQNSVNNIQLPKGFNWWWIIIATVIVVVCIGSVLYVRRRDED